MLRLDTVLLKNSENTTFFWWFLDHKDKHEVQPGSRSSTDFWQKESPARR